MRVSVYTIAAFLAGVATAKECMDITVPLSLESRNAVFGNMATPYTALVSFSERDERHTAANCKQDAVC